MSTYLALIPVYNKQATLARAVKSVLAQSLDCDLLVIDDGSTDQSLSIAKEFEDKKVKVISQSNKGVSHTRNRGISYAMEHGYEFILFLDADDYWMPDHISEIARAIELLPDASIYGNNYKIKVSEKKLNKTKISKWKAELPTYVKPFFKHNFLNAVLSSSSFAMRLTNGDPIMYDDSLTHTEDTDFTIRAGMEKKIVFNPKYTVVIDQTAPNRSGNVQLQDRTITDFDAYEEKADQHPGLKKFLDINRFSIAIGYRLQKDIKNAALYQHKIDLNNLTSKQRNLLVMSTRQLKALKRTQRILGNLGFRLRTGR